MFEFLKRLPRSEIVGAVLSPNDPGISRGEMLRRKYSAEIASANAVALCPPASNARIAECENSVAPIRMPAELREFLAVCDGECTFGAVLPNIQFFGVSAIIESRTMLRKMMEEEMLPDDFEHDLPFGRDMRTRLLVVNCTGDVGAGVVLILGLQVLRHVDELDVRCFAEGGEDGGGELDPGVSFARAEVEEAAGARSLGEVERHADGVLHIEEVAHLFAVFVVRAVGFEELDFAGGEDLAEVQVSKGYVSVLNGPGGLGGAVNLVTRKPSRDFEAEVVAAVASD